MASSQWRGDGHDYRQLKDLTIRLDQQAGGGEGSGSIGFSLSLWVYLSGSPRPSSVILRQVLSEKDEVPFLALSEENRLTLFPLMFLHKDAPSPDVSFPWSDISHISAYIQCPLEKWVHVGCEVAANYMRLHVDGTLAGEKTLSLLSEANSFDILKRITLVGNDGKDGKLQGYVYNVRVLAPSASTNDLFVKNPPVKLSLDGSCIFEGVEEVGDGVWGIVGGKASCRRNFTLEVVLLDALGQSVHKEMEIVASLLYADNGTLVEKTSDETEAPLLISSDGVEFPSTDKPVSLLRGRAIFKLKISQLSSKSDNRLFRVCFCTPHAQRYPFLEAYSPPIRCISRSRTSRISAGKRLTSLFCNDLPRFPGSNDGSQSILDICEDRHLKNTVNPNELKCIPPLKRLKLDYHKSSVAIDANLHPEQDETTYKVGSELKSNNVEGTDSASSGSGSTDARNFESTWTSQTVAPISDSTIFKYCLADTHERAQLLKEIVTSSSNNQDMANFAEKVSLYAGCCHHRHQILISRQLVQDATDTWNLISQNSHRAIWTEAVPEINKKFTSIANSTRVLSGKDVEILQGIAGCGEELSRENFDRMWCWLYPVAYSLSEPQINAMWTSSSIKWIEGFITTDEAENSLRGPEGLKEPGTFVLRFPTSRSWPHPDAGSLVVTYVGTDSTLHHRLLSRDRCSGENAKGDQKLLQTLLLEEPELSQLGRVTRESMPCPEYVG